MAEKADRVIVGCMCYSALIKSQLKTLEKTFGANISLEAFQSFYAGKIEHPEWKTPFGLDRYFLLSQDPQEAKIAPLIRQFYEHEKQRIEQEISAVEEQIKKLEAGKPTATNKKSKEAKERKRAKLILKRGFSFDRISPLDERIYPGSFAPVIVEKEGKRLIVPMRYRVRRPDGMEIPAQYNVFNARKDSLLSAATWKPLFGKTHGIFPFIKFFEWVERDGGKKEISFTPENRSLMWAASLYSETKGSFSSFAMVTDDPPSEVAAAGHDRCPIFLRESSISDWLEPAGKSKEHLIALLDNKEKAFYIDSLVA